MIASFIGIIAGICTSASLFPQLLKIIRERKAEDISWGMLVILISGLGLWVVYGFMKNDLPIILTNLFALVINALTIWFTYKYKK